jgi:hypothetical protein
VADTAALYAVVQYGELKAITHGLFDQYLRCDPAHSYTDTHIHACSHSRVFLRSM